MQIFLTVPFPPSVNHYWRMAGSRVYICAAGRNYRKAVADEVMILRMNKKLNKQLKVTITAYRPDAKRRDLDNLLKAVLDALTHAGVYEDDSLICDLRICWGAGNLKKLDINIEEIESDDEGREPRPAPSD